MPKGEDFFIGSLDQGTTSTRFIIYDRHARSIGSHQVEFTQFYPEAGWVEHDPVEILESVRACMAKAVDKATADGHNVDDGLKAIGLTNQRETTLLWSKSTGSPLYNAIVWMDVRTSSVCRNLEKELSGGRTHFIETCGLPISTYFSAMKLIWLMENVDAVKEAVKAGDALFGTIDTWLIWNLTGGVNGGLHVTDVSNASRTMLMNLKTLDWDKPTLEALNIPAEILPRIVSNSEVIGNIGKGWPVTGIPISGCLGDQHAAMVGQACRKGEAKSTYGTGAFILLNTGEEIIQSKHGLLSTLAFKLGPQAPTNYALEGSIAIAGAAVQWLRDSLGIIASASEIENLALQVESTGGVYFVPAFNGLFAPWWRDDARGVCIGITRFTTKAHIARAVLESMCFQVKDVLDSMHKDAGEKGEVKSEQGEFLLRVDGGATVNNLLMQIQADLLGTPVVRPADIETTALGAAYAAGLAVGVWTEEEIFASGERVKTSTTFRPKLEEQLREKKVNSWCKAVERTFDLADLSI
ncbi:FGGY_N domain-containing protein/FGGY_C domain-containing protein [Cephalotus follicularis]|uniref:glycerol kinase n=1 Tax=Cephalotus follicularis TaxID=3775 RepID=A0A1Q3CDB7_CEPFO|nr:FGGY_N domain-containing protein/FGGY_C domain-containing protein [Cephalotus follicularis]